MVERQWFSHQNDDLVISRVIQKPLQALPANESAGAEQQSGISHSCLMLTKFNF
jgi:hypothetical protein